MARESASAMFSARAFAFACPSDGGTMNVMLIVFPLEGASAASFAEVRGPHHGAVVIVPVPVGPHEDAILDRRVVGLARREELVGPRRSVGPLAGAFDRRIATADPGVHRDDASHERLFVR